MYRHGDVLIESIKELPKGAHRLPHVILAQGELTGHAHRVVPTSAAALYQENDQLFLSVLEEGAQVVHEEHAAIPLPKGTYKVWRQREYSPKEIRVIRD